MILSHKKTWSEIKSLVYVVVFAFCIRIFLIEPFFIPSTSMYDTLKIGDYVFATKYNYGYSNYSFPFAPNLFAGRIFASEPNRGDIIIFKAKNTGITERFIKRLIGLPGDKVQLLDSNLYINDKKVAEEHIGKIRNRNGMWFDQFKETLPNGRSYNIVKIPSDNTNTNRIYYVPKYHYFFLGDNRDQSADSRYRMGYVTNQELIGKAQFIFFSTARYLWLDHVTIKEQIINIGYWLKSIRFKRIFHYLYN